MRSLFDDIMTVLEAHTFSIPNVTIRKPYDESPKTFPAIVVHEVVNIPYVPRANTEERTALGYQLDVMTANCVDGSGTVLTRWEAGRALESEVVDLLDSALRMTRRSRREEELGSDVLTTMLRFDCVADSYGYSYRL